jgi:hypothetical protein
MRRSCDGVRYGRTDAIKIPFREICAGAARALPRAWTSGDIFCQQAADVGRAGAIAGLGLVAQTASVVIRMGLLVSGGAGSGMPGRQTVRPPTACPPQIHHSLIIRLDETPGAGI